MQMRMQYQLWEESALIMDEMNEQIESDKISMLFAEIDVYIVTHTEDSLKENSKELIESVKYGDETLSECFKKLDKDKQQQITNYMKEIYFRDTSINNNLVRELFRTMDIKTVDELKDIYGMLSTSSRGNINRTMQATLHNWYQCERVMAFFTSIILLIIGRKALTGNVNLCFTIVMSLVALYSLFRKEKKFDEID